MHNMKGIPNSLTTVQCAVLLLAQSLLAVADVSVPLNGTFKGAETSESNFPHLYVDGQVEPRGSEAEAARLRFVSVARSEKGLE